MMESGSWPRAIRMIGLSLIVLVTLALAGCTGIGARSPFMDVYLDMEDSGACKHLRFPSIRRPGDKARAAACESDWMRRRIEQSLQERFPLGSDVDDLVRYLVWEDFVCIKFNGRQAFSRMKNYKCYFDSIDQNYNPVFFLTLPRYVFEMAWRITIDYSEGKIFRLDSWYEMRGEGKS